MAQDDLQMHMTEAHYSRFVFLGMRTRFSLHVLEELLRANMKPAAVWLPASGAENDIAIRLRPPEPMPSELPLLNPHLIHDVASTAWQHAIAVYEVSDLSSPETLALLSNFQVRIGVVACFPFKLPSAMLKIPAHGFLNLHPSLLPEFRGPYPVFWTLRGGVTNTGVTLHVVDNGLDTGALVAQNPVLLPDGLTGRAADALLAEKGTELLVRALAILSTGELATRSQGAGGSYQGRPSRDDFTIPTTWQARRAFNFMRGTADWNHPFTIEGINFRLKVGNALSFDPENTPGDRFVRQNREAVVAFNPGWVRVRIL